MDGLCELEVEPTDVVEIEKVGSGCTAEVFRGTFRQAEVAIKVIDWNKAEMNPKHQLAFDREVAILGRIDHVNLIKLMGICSLQRPFKIITEYAGGGCCFELLHNNDNVELVWSQQIKMCKDTAQAMEYLHSFDPRIIHRDLKSLNLLLSTPVTSPDDVPIVKVSDFGMARMMETAGDKGPEAYWNNMTAGAGTCHWMAPECANSSYGPKVDVYSFAMIMFEVICREIPFEDVEPATVLTLVTNKVRPDLAAVPPDIPDPDLQTLMETCWEHDPAARPEFSECVRRLCDIEARVC